MAGSHTTVSAISPAIGGFSITPADSDLAARARAIWVGTQGDLRVTFVNGDDVVIKNASGLLPISVRRVWATNTTAMTANDILTARKRNEGLPELSNAKQRHGDALRAMFSFAVAYRWSTSCSSTILSASAPNWSWHDGPEGCPLDHCSHWRACFHHSPCLCYSASVSSSGV